MQTEPPNSSPYNVPTSPESKYLKPVAMVAGIAVIALGVFLIVASQTKLFPDLIIKNQSINFVLPSNSELYAVAGAVALFAGASLNGCLLPIWLNDRNHRKDESVLK